MRTFTPQYSSFRKSAEALDSVILRQQCLDCIDLMRAYFPRKNGRDRYAVIRAKQFRAYYAWEGYPIQFLQYTVSILYEAKTRGIELAEDGDLVKIFRGVVMMYQNRLHREVKAHKPPWWLNKVLAKSHKEFLDWLANDPEEGTPREISPPLVIPIHWGDYASLDLHGSKISDGDRANLRWTAASVTLLVSNGAQYLEGRVMTYGRNNQSSHQAITRRKNNPWVYLFEVLKGPAHKSIYMLQSRVRT